MAHPKLGAAQDHVRIWKLLRATLGYNNRLLHQPWATFGDFLTPVEELDTRFAWANRRLHAQVEVKTARIQGLSTTTMVVAMVYKISRVYLIVGALRSTYYLPPESYIATWASSVSHLRYLANSGCAVSNATW